MRLNEDLFQRSTATRHPSTDRKSDRLTWTHTAPMGLTGWSQRDTLTTGHGHCRDNLRGSIREIGAIAKHFARRGYKLHGFGLKTSALRAYAPSPKTSSAGPRSSGSSILTYRASSPAGHQLARSGPGQSVWSNRADSSPVWHCGRPRSTPPSPYAARWPAPRYSTAAYGPCVPPRG